VDLFPTMCELVGAPIPDSVQGRSLVPLLRQDPAPGDWRDAVFSQIGDVFMIRTSEFKLNVYGGEPGELFGLRDDPREFYNRIDDPAYAGTVASLFERLKAWEAANR
jgi:arylsulfatase A-like enzyme